MANRTDMLKKFLAVVGLILLYTAVWVPLLYIWTILWKDNETVIVIGLLTAAVFIIVSAIPYFNFAIKKLFYFPGEGEPVTEEEIRALIKDINQFDAPVWVREKGKKLIVTWKYVDAKWWEILAKAGLTEVYELHIKLDGKKKEATLIDVFKSVSWGAGPTAVRVYGGFFRGVAFGYAFGKQWGIKENFKLGKVYDYKFSPQEIKNPVMNSLLRNGWAVRFGIW